MKSLFIVIPCYNEENIISKTAAILTAVINSLVACGLISYGKIIFVNDKSTDGTECILEELCLENPMIEEITAEKNSGQQKAILKGLEYSLGRCDFVITMDCDLQDDTDSIREMIIEYNKGISIVYGVRSDRKSDSAAKRISAALYYFILALIDKNTVKNHGDFRLMDNAAVEKALKYSGKFPYLRGLVPKLGFKGGIVYYSRNKRIGGKSKYNIMKMLRLSFCGIYTAFLKVPRALPLNDPKYRSYMQ